MTARIQAVLEPIQTRVMTGVHQYQAENGRRKIRCEVNPRLRPGDTIQAGAVEFVAHSIQYAISPASAWMEVQEAPNG